MGASNAVVLLLGAAAAIVLAAGATPEAGPGLGEGSDGHDGHSSTPVSLVTPLLALQAVPTADGWTPVAGQVVEDVPNVQDAGPEPANATNGDRAAHTRALRHPVHSRLQHHMKPKRLHRPQDSMSSNKVEVFVAAPSSMMGPLGSFSALGGLPGRGRTPAHEKLSTSTVTEKQGSERPERQDKLHAQETRYLLDTRVSFPYELLPPPMGLQQRPVQYKNPTEQDQSPSRKSQQQQTAADEPRQQVIFFGQPHLSHGPSHSAAAPSSSGFKFNSGGSLSFFERPQLQVFPQVGLGQGLFSPFSNAPIYGQPAPELFRKDTATQSPLFFRGHSPALPAVPQQTPRPPPPAQQIPDFRFVPPITSSALDHSFSALTQSFIPPADRAKQQQGQSGYSFSTTKLPFHIAGNQGHHQGAPQGSHQGHQLHQGGHQLQLGSYQQQTTFQTQGFPAHGYQQPKPGFHLKDVVPTKESFSTKRPQLQLQQASNPNLNKQPLIPSPKFPSDDFSDGLSAFAQPANKPAKTTLVNFGLHSTRDDTVQSLGRPNKIKLTDGNPVEEGKDERQGPPHSYAQINTPHGLGGVSLAQPLDEGGAGGRLSFGKEDAKPIQQRPPEKQRITRPFFQDDAEKPALGLHSGLSLQHHSLHGHRGFSLTQQTSPNYGPQTFPTPPNFLFEHRPANPGAYVPLFAATPTPTPEPLEPAFQTTTPFREETTLPPTHINEVHSPPLRPTSATRHRFHAVGASATRDEDDDVPAPFTEAEEKPSFHKRVPLKGRRRKPYSSSTSTTTTTTTTEDPPSVQLDRHPSPTDDPALDIHELQLPVEPVDAAVPPATTARPLRRRKPVRPAASDRIRNRLVPPELIKTTTPEPDTTTFYPDTTTLPDIGDFRLPERPLTPSQLAQPEQEFGHLFGQLPSAVPTLQDFSSLEDFKMEEPARPSYPDEYTKPEEQYSKFAGDEYKLDYPKADEPKEVIPDAGPSSYLNFDSRPGSAGAHDVLDPAPTSLQMPQQLSSATPTQAEQAAASSAVSDAQDELQTTPAPAVETTTATLSSRLRPRIRFNTTRPRFSVKDYHGRKPTKDGEAEASATSTTTAPAPASNRGRLPSRTRGSHRHTTEADPATSTEASRLRYRTKDPLRFNSNRYRSTSTTTTTTTTEAPPGDTADAATEVSTEKASDKLFNRFRPGTGKYYSRYRTSTSTEAPAAEVARLERPSLRTPPAPAATRTKGVFSVRRPQTTAVSKAEDANDEDENYPVHHPGTLPTPKTHIQRLGPASPAAAASETDRSDTVRDNEVLPADALDVASTASAAPAPAPTAELPSSTTAWSLAGLADLAGLGGLGDLSDVQIDSSAEDMMLSPSQRVAELTSSPGNNYSNNPGVFKSVMPASRRTPLKVNLSTDDPILPIEAFFNSWSKDQKSS